jgi:hypothetical protein
VVLVHGVIVAHYDKNDRAAEGYAISPCSILDMLNRKR